MPKPASTSLFQPRPLDEITAIPDDIISVYAVEKHIWADGGSPQARAERRPERRTVEEFLIDPVRSLLEGIFRQLAAPWDPNRRDNPIGQGYWIQAEFGSGKSHLLSFVGALALGDDEAWEIVRRKEEEAGRGRRDSLYTFYESGLRQKIEAGRGVFVVVKTLVGQGSGTIGLEGSSTPLVEYILEAVAEQFHLETGRSLPFFPTEILAERFLNGGDLDRYRQDLQRFLKDPDYFDDEEQQELADFLHDLQDNPDPALRRDCGDRLWRFYRDYLQITPRIPTSTEAVLEHMVRRILDAGYSGVLLIIDEVSLFMRNRRDERERGEDEDTLIALANRLAKISNLPVWTVCAAQQAIESAMAGVKNIHADERLRLCSLLNNQADYYDIALRRVRTVTEPTAVDMYYEAYKRAFSWPQNIGRDEFARFFPFFPPGIDVVRAISYNLTTIRSALYFMLETLKTQRKRRSREPITLWSLFDEVVDYEEDPSGTTRGIASVRTKWPDAWAAYERARNQIDAAPRGRLRVYRDRCVKILRTLFLYHVAELAPGGLTHEELMNGVMEWKDHDKGRAADLDDNLGHYEVLAGELATELVEVRKEGERYLFYPSTEGPSPADIFARARAEAEASETEQRQAWQALLALDGWRVESGLVAMDLMPGMRSIFGGIAPQGQQEVSIEWHRRLIKGRVLMRDLVHEAGSRGVLPSVNSSETDLDFVVFVSSRPADALLDGLIAAKGDPRIIFWTPDTLTDGERALLLDYAAYRIMVTEWRAQETQKGQEVMAWVRERLQGAKGPIHNIVPASYGRGRMAALDHGSVPFACQGELSAIVAPVVGRLLDDVYVSKELVFDGAPAPLDDTNIINVMNGIVRTGEIPRGARPDRYTSAAQNYGFGLKIMRPPNDRVLDLSDCRYTRDMLAWIEEKLPDATASMPVSALYKNFQGIGGPNGVHYGLSKRLVQLYLLCLVREGHVRVEVSGRSLFGEYLDYANLDETDLRANVLDTMQVVRRLQAPEGWEVLAPYVAALLDDETILSAQQDAEIQDAVTRLLQWREEQLPRARELREGLANLLADLGATDSLDERLGAWEAFLSAPVPEEEPLLHVRHALAQAFGYEVYERDAAAQDEVDDLTARRIEVENAAALYGYRDRLRPVGRYARHALPELRPLAEARAALARVHQRLPNLTAYLGNGAGLLADVLEPAEAAMRGYATHFLHAYEGEVRRATEAREAIAALEEGPAFRTLERLAGLPQLGADPCPALRDAFRRAVATLLPSDTAYDAVRRELRERPEPTCTPLNLANAREWRSAAEGAPPTSEAALREALLAKAALLDSPALRARLEALRREPFIAGLLACADVAALADRLIETLGADGAVAADARLELLRRALRQVVVIKRRLADFRPTKSALERDDVDAVVAEFRRYLLDAFQPDGDAWPIVELE